MIEPAARLSAARALLARHGFTPADLRPLAADASFRRYFRLRHGSKRAVLMDAPPERENVAPFVAVARHLTAGGFRAPLIFDADEYHGLVLLEDLGDDTFTRLLDAGVDPHGLYGQAVDLLIRLHGDASMAGIDVPEYDTDMLLRESALFVDWYLPEVTGKKTAEADRTDFLAAWRSVLNHLPKPPTSLVLRDFHVDNLILVRGKDQTESCGLLDFQDAVLGAPAYDLVSLLEDARRDVSGDLAAIMLSRYLLSRPEVDPASFKRWYTVLGAQRHAKVAGIFVRLYERDGKDTYLQHLPRVLRLLRRALGHADLAPVSAWVNQVVPDLPIPKT